MEGAGFVSEYPPPPAHYRCFDAPDSAPPPALPAEGLSLSEEYLRKLELPLPDPADLGAVSSSADLKGMIKCLLKELVDLVCVPHTQDPAPHIDALHRRAADISRVLRAVRTHEARENTCTAVRQQLNSLLKVESELQR